MKTITYLDVEYEVPDWVKFVIADANGTLYGYEYRPVGYGGIPGSYTARRGRYVFIKDIKPNYPLVEV